MSVCEYASNLKSFKCRVNFFSAVCVVWVVAWDKLKNLAHRYHSNTHTRTNKTHNRNMLSGWSAGGGVGGGGDWLTKGSLTRRTQQQQQLDKQHHSTVWAHSEWEKSRRVNSQIETDLDRDGQSVISEGLKAEAARLLGGLPDGHQVPRTLQVQRHALHQLLRATREIRPPGALTLTKQPEWGQIS